MVLLLEFLHRVSDEICTLVRFALRIMNELVQSLVVIFKVLCSDSLILVIVDLPRLHTTELVILPC